MTIKRALTLGVLCISDDGTSDIGVHAAELARRILGGGHRLAGVRTVTNDRGAIHEQIQTWADAGDVDAVLTLDRSIFGTDAQAAGIPFTQPPATGPAYGIVLNDAVFGYVGVIDIRAAHRQAALPQHFSKDGETLTVGRQYYVRYLDSKPEPQAAVLG